MKTALHELVQQQILEACDKLGLHAQMEYAGDGWRADVLVLNNGKKYAFEIQITPQSLKKTQERQEKYIKEDIVGCWLFEKEPARQSVELEDLPIFRLIEEGGSFDELIDVVMEALGKSLGNKPVEDEEDKEDGEEEGLQ